MSLINQALRKAQRDRTPSRMSEPGTTGPSPATPGSGSGMRPGLLIGLIAGFALLIGLVVGLSFAVFSRDSSPPLAQQQAGPTEGSGDAPQAQLEATQPRAADSPSTPEITSAKQNAAVPAPLNRENTSSIVEELRKARSAAEAKAAAELKAAQEAAAKAAAAPNQEIIDWLSRARVTGVKVSPTDSKIIFNGESYSVGEYVNYALKLKILVIQENRILFIDDNGKKYMKRI